MTGQNILFSTNCITMVRRVVRRRRAPARRRPGMRRMRKRAVGRSNIKRTSDYAKLVETTEFSLIANKTAGGVSVGGNFDFCLQDYNRAQEVAHAYKYYRAAKVEAVFIPYFNIAQTGGGGNTQLPQLYASIDRVSNRYIVPSEEEMIERSVTPKLFNKKIRLNWKPNLLQGISMETGQPADGAGAPLGFDLMGYQNAIPLFDKWLPTQQSYGYQVAPPGGQIGQVLAPNGVNPYALKYHGLIYVAAIEGQANNTDVSVGDLQLRITWEFKGPRALKTNSPLPEPNEYVVTSSQGNPGAVPNTQPTTYP